MLLVHGFAQIVLYAMYVWAVFSAGGERDGHKHKHVMKFPLAVPFLSLDGFCKNSTCNVDGDVESARSRCIRYGYVDQQSLLLELKVF